ncbi:MAG: hypothetical protein Q9192_005901, partial [Flavoplaca navasiana]
MHYIPIPKDDEMYNADFSEDENIEKVSLNGTGFEFKCFSEDSATGTTKAVFELEEDIYDGFKARITSSLSTLMYVYTEPDNWLEECYANPRHYISIAKEANDTELPALEWNSERIEIALDWEKMFHKFFAEEDAYQRAVHDALDGQGPRLRAKLDAGEADKMECFEMAFKILGDAHDNSRKSTRRDRLRRQLRGLPKDEREEIIRTYENPLLQGLKEIRCALSWPSDNEAGSEDDEIEEDESEDDQSGGNENRIDGTRSDGSRDAPMTLEEYLDLGVVEDDEDSDDEMG